MAGAESKEKDSWRWYSVSEESLLLHNDLLQLVGHISLPSGVGDAGTDEEYGLPVLDGKTPQELVEIITQECSVMSNTYTSLMEYRLNALKELWTVMSERKDKAVSKKTDDSSNGSVTGTKGNQKGEGFASRVSLVLIFPVLKSLCKIDPQLSQETAGLLLESLQACDPLSLSSEPTDCINGLEGILCSWLKSAQEDDKLAGDVRERQLQIAASALVALAVAVGTGGLLLRTVHTLQSLSPPSPSINLIVPKILQKLLRVHIVTEEPSALSTDTHLSCWGYETEQSQGASDGGDSPRSVVFDGDYLYTSTAGGQWLLKLGTAINGTLRGYVYNKRELEKGWIVFISGCGQLLHRKISCDGKQDTPFLTLLNRKTLEDSGEVHTGFQLPSEPHSTLQFISDGQLLYWLYYLKTQDVTHPRSGERVKQHLIYLQVLTLETKDDSQLSIVPKGERLLISKPLSDDPRGSNDAVKSFMRSGSYSFSAMLGGAAKDDQVTSCGLGLKQVQGGTAYCTGSSLVLVTAPPANNSGRSLFGVSGSSSKALCLSFCYSLSTGTLVSQSDLPTSPNIYCGLGKGGSVHTLAVCYDGYNHCIWSVTDQWVDTWTCVGKVKPAAHVLSFRMGKLTPEHLIPILPDSDTISITEAIRLLLRHSGIESCRLTPGKDFYVPVPHSLTLKFLDYSCSILEYSLDKQEMDNCLSIVITLQAVLPGYFSSKNHSPVDLAPLKIRIRASISKMLKLDLETPALYTELKKLISHNCKELYFEDEGEAIAFVSELQSSPSLADLRNEVLMEIASQLKCTSQLSPVILRMIPLIGEDLTNQCTVTMETLEADTTTTCQPVFSPALQTTSAILKIPLRSLIRAINSHKELLGEEADTETIATARENMEEQCTVLLDLTQKLGVFESCGKMLNTILELIAMSGKKQEMGVVSDNVGVVSDTTPSEESAGEDEAAVATPPKSGTSFGSLEKACKGSVLGALLPPLLAVLGDIRECSLLPLATQLLEHLSKLGGQCTEVCSILYKGQKKVQIPAPWASGRTIETIHPVRDNYKFKETVSFPGARHLYLKFDPRCSSQYDYDKVMVYASETTTGSKVAEYGGNTHGFGSRSVLGKGWPTDLVKVDGDKVTIMFEMKSGREHSTPDKAMWGLSCTVRPQEVAEDSPLGLPFLLDLYLSISSVSCSLIGQLFNGAPPTEDETKCEVLMKSSLLQRCTWPDNSLIVTTPSPRDSLLPSVIEKIRTLIKKPRPALRKSTNEILQIDYLEDIILSTCLKHHGIASPLVVAVETNIETNQILLEEIFSRINGLERRLQALAELETKWQSDIEDIASDTLTVSKAFFQDMAHQESFAKSFELLCCLMAVEPASATAAKDLESVMERDVLCFKEEGQLHPHPKVKRLVGGVIERSRLLLQVSISAPSCSHAMPPLNVSRSVSAPAHVFDPRPLRRQRSDTNRVSGSILIEPQREREGEGSVLDEIFQFIGSKPEEAVSCSSFLSAASHQHSRAVNRVQALQFLQSLLTSSNQLGSTVEHVLACVGGVLRNGPRISDIPCSGLVTPVRDAFADVMNAVVGMASHQPVSCINIIALLSIVPYTHEEESCLVRSGLVKLLDHLCSLSNLPSDCEGSKEGGEGEERGEALQRVTALAWAAFQVLAERCVSWETRSTGFISSGLAQQVSLLLTNHLSRAMDSLVTSESGTSDTLQEALSMLLGLARSHMGRTILSQPACVSKLLLLLTDQRPSPKLVLIALQLCRVALPLMTQAECSQVVIPSHPTFSDSLQSDNLPSNIITLLMAKLAEYLVPSLSQPVTKLPAEDGSSNEENVPSLPSQSTDESEENGQASVYIHRRQDENAGELLQLLLNRDPRLSSLNIDTILANEGKAEMYTDTYKSCFRRAVRWANMGFLVSIETPVGGTSSRGPSGTESDVKKAKAESTCKLKNIELLKTNPPRPFLSGTVAYSLAGEIIGLLNGLLADPDAAQVWKKAIQNVLKTSLETVPTFLPELEKYCNRVIMSVRDCLTPPSPDKYFSISCLANATFAVLGGFEDTVRPNMRVQVSGDGIEDCYGTVISISERRGVANVQFNEDEYCFGANQTLETPLCRLKPPAVGSLSLDQLDLLKQLSNAMLSIVSTQGLVVDDPHSGMDASVQSMGLCRLFAELRTRAFMCLSHHLTSEEFRDVLLRSCDVVDFVKQAEKCETGMRLSVVESHCLGLRMLYRDCARPPPPKIEKPRITRKKYSLDITRSWPPLSSCSFSHSLTAVVYQGPTFTEGGGEDKPKGALILTTSPIPRQAPSFYWEVEVIQFDPSSNSPQLAMGYCPNVVKVEGQEVWSYPEGTCLLRSSGRGCQVTGDDRMKWKKINLDTPLKKGDVIGCGWLKEDTPDIKGVVYFTVNGTRIEQQFKDAPSNMYPFLHLQQKTMRVKANFGDRPFVYSEGHAHRDAADVPEGESLEEIVALFKELPFHPYDDEEGEGGGDVHVPPLPQPTEEVKPMEIKHEPLVTDPPSKELETPKLPAKDYTYKSSTSILYPLRQSFDTMLESGPLIRPGGGNNNQEDEGEGETQGVHAEEDLHGLLVKAWESKVFPKIQRRFRNDQERKSGLEQIKGALQLGMESIAQETVEFLYEENGGLPKDLCFPTIDDVKADLEKFNISRVKKGSAVVILKEFPYGRCGVRAMQKTQGLTGIILSVDQPNELVQVECYIPSDGALVRFWYPVMYLEKPPKGYRKPSALRGAESVNILVHRELLQCELLLSAMYCRSSLITLHAPSVTHPSPISVPSFLSLVALHSFSQPSIEGLCSSTSPALSPTLRDSLETVISTPQRLFYSSPNLLEGVCQSLLDNPPKDLVYIITEICNKLCISQEGLGQREFVIADGKETTDVCCAKGSFVSVSAVEEKAKNDSKPSYKYPWGKVFIYRGGQGKGGHMLLQEVIRYPNEIPQSTTQQYCGPAHPSLILPTNRIHLKLGGCSPHPGKLISVVGVSELLPLVMSLADLLSKQIYDHYSVHNRPSGLEGACTGLSHCVLSLIKTICRIDCPPVLKEMIFKSLSNSLWTLGCVPTADSNGFPPIPVDFIKGVVQEVEQVYETESGLFATTKSNRFPPEGSIGAGGLGKFSTYFQTLLELVLSSSNYTSVHHQATPVKATPTDGKKGSAKKNSNPQPVKNKSWLKYVTRIVDLLRRLVQGRPIDREFYNLYRKSLPVRPETKLLVISGMDQQLEKDTAVEIITQICNKYGGMVPNGLYLPSIDIEPALEETKDGADKGAESKPEATPIKSLVCGGCVIELSCSDKTSVVSGALLSAIKLQGVKKEIAVSSVSQEFKCGEDKKGNDILREYLHHRLFDGRSFRSEAKNVISRIYKMAAYDGGRVSRSTLEEKEGGDSYLRLLVLRVVGERDVKKVLAGVYEGKKGAEFVNEGKLLDWLEKEGKSDVRGVWCGLCAAGYDLHYSRCGFLPNDACSCSPNSSKDHALACHVDTLCRKLGVVSANLLPWDMVVTETDLTSSTMLPLQEDTPDDIRVRFLQLKQFNRQFSWLLPLVDLCSAHPASLGSALSHVGRFLFYDSKITFLHSIINSSTRRSMDQAPPEIRMDPLEAVGGIPSSVVETQFCQAAKQALSIPSPQLCVPLASGGDPTYAFNVKLAGEEVHGTSGSFRHFLWQVVKELQSSLLPILTLCPSHSAGINKGKYILATGPMGYSVEKMLEFFGQLLGVAIRADVPVAIDLLGCFWKSLREESLTVEDLKEADSITYSLTKRIIEAPDEAAFEELVDGIFQKNDDSSSDGYRQPRFIYHNLRGFEEEICVGGYDKELNYTNREEYALVVQQFRLKELACEDKMVAIRCGMASIIPIQLLRLLTAEDLSLRVCGVPDVDLSYLKLHTTYHVGLMEEDQHIKYFWNALETFSQEELRKFIKFACNQERIPFGEPCRGGDNTVTHVPPYPMKIAPPDGSDPPDSRYVRAETCMFLVKIPQYSYQELMTERLKYAITCREDPLSG